MNTLFIGKNFVELPQVDSTNAFLSGLLESGPAEGTVVYCENQFAGRGQQGNAWLAEPGQNIACSVFLKPVFLAPSQIFLLNKAVALALAQALQAFLPGQELLLKWPNDILLNRRKLAGILIENQLGSAHVQASVLGFGINVNQVQFDAGYGNPVSMALAAGRDFVLKEVLNSVLSQIERFYLALRAGRNAAIEQDYLHMLYGYQEEVPAIVEGEKRMVIPVGVDVHGRLAVQVDGRLRYFGIKEIAFPL